MCFVPEHHSIFRLRRVEENLLLGARKDSPVATGRLYRNFPRLNEQRTNRNAQLFGGERQMRAIGCALTNHPRLLMLDEPVEGLAPANVEEFVPQLRLIRGARVTIQLVEQNLEICTQLASYHSIIEQAVIVHSDENASFAVDYSIKDPYLGVSLA